MGHTDTDDNVNGTPRDAAARAACTSPRRQIHLPQFLQHPLPQRQIAQIRHIAPQGVLVVRAPVDVVEQERRQAAFGGEAVIVGGGDDHGCLNKTGKCYLSSVDHNSWSALYWMGRFKESN